MQDVFVDSGFPDPGNAKINWDAPCSLYGWPNMAFTARAREIYYPEHLGPLSVKCAFGGQEVYEAQGRRHAVDDFSYLILNDGQSYSSYIESGAEVESFCIFFHPAFARSVLRTLTAPAERLLDDPAEQAGMRMHFFEHLYPHDKAVSPLLLRMRAAIQKGKAEQGWLEEQFYLLMERMLHVHEIAHADAERLQIARPSTRAEIVQRLHWAKDYMDSTLHLPFRLGRVAEVACLSPHHFLRLFKQLFRLTPNQYVTQQRLRAATRLLRKTEMPVTDICMEVGFSSLGYFSWLFRRNFGLSPLQYRAAGGEI